MLYVRVRVDEIQCKQIYMYKCDVEAQNPKPSLQNCCANQKRTKKHKDEAKRANKEITVPEIQHNLNSTACALYQKCIRIAVQLS